ncbi:hypothetical protein T265_04457 [Opisthorchis viverrini]|uniref:Uncharacterized protein n=1 Tax=Opisthorchis viverrini TaxID=6198 RepID=A0A074ZNT6_OPIVI|nr:hypothetical protein T265_04457 [Opisthorchis viverrini]KER28766.1 hypothetical protein T265_04457 [Opisthorchis viverrini]
MPHEGSTRAGTLPGCPSLDRRSREVEVGFEPRTFRSVSSRSIATWSISPCAILSLFQGDPGCLSSIKKPFGCNTLSVPN